MTAVRVDQAGPAVTVTIERPQARNAVDRQTAAELPTRSARSTRTTQQRSRCSRARAVCSARGPTSRRSRSERVIESNRMADGPMGPTRLRLSKPVIAAVAGHAVAGGLELACWCDLRVAEEDAVFGVFCRRWGVPLIDGGTVRLPRLIGMSRALDMILTGRGVGAREAYEMGLANRVVPNGESLRAAQELALEIARFPQVTMRGDRQSTYEQAGLSLEDAMARELEIGGASLAQAREGASRFASGRGRHGDFEQI